MEKIIEIDGSYLEGGGQIVRTALALSIITKKGFHITNIRNNRPNPGLKAQHLTAVNTLAELFDVQVQGNELGSGYLTFIPKDNKLQKSTVLVNIGTAGSVTLLMQSLLPALLFAEKQCTLAISGGTDVEFSPSVDYFSNVFLPHLSRFGNIHFELINRGYFPKGNGMVRIKVMPSSFKEKIPFNLISQQKLIHIKGISHAADDLAGAKVAERQAESAKRAIQGLNAATITTEYRKTFSKGSGITLFALFGDDEINKRNPVILGSCALGDIRKRAEEVGEEAAHALLKEINIEAAVDCHMADQLIPYLAIVGGAIKTSKITKHTLTNIYAVQKFMNVKFSIDEENKIIKVNG